MNISISSFLNLDLPSTATSSSSIPPHLVCMEMMLLFGRQFMILRLNAITYLTYVQVRKERKNKTWKGKKRIETQKTRRASWIDLTTRYYKSLDIPWRMPIAKWMQVEMLKLTVACRSFARLAFHHLIRQFVTNFQQPNLPVVIVSYALPLKWPSMRRASYA